jgi:hypothetical protein
MQQALLTGSLQAVSIVTNCWLQSIRFYVQALGYQIRHEGMLNNAQRKAFGEHLGRYALLGHTQGSLVRLLETSLTDAMPNRMGARPWDLGMAVIEAGTTDIDRRTTAYYAIASGLSLNLPSSM